MRNIVRIIGATLASMAGILLVSGVAWAQAQKTPITWWNTGYQLLEEAERFWVDEDGIEHGRDEMYRNPRNGDLIGSEVGWLSWDLDRATGDYFERGHFSYTGRLFRLPTSGFGHYTIECHTIEGVQSCTSDDLVRLDGSGLVKTTWEGGQTDIYSGFLLDSPRRGRRGSRR